MSAEIALVMHRKGSAKPPTLDIAGPIPLERFTFVQQNPRSDPGWKDDDGSSSDDGTQGGLHVPMTQGGARGTIHYAPHETGQGSANPGGTAHEPPNQENNRSK